MAQSEWRVELALFSDSFRSTVAGLVEELGGTVSAANPGDDRRATGADVVLLLAGGAESEALDFLADSGSTGARYMIGAAADHRIAAAALQSGASVESSPCSSPEEYRGTCQAAISFLPGWRRASAARNLAARRTAPESTWSLPLYSLSRTTRHPWQRSTLLFRSEEEPKYLARPAARDV